MCEMKKEEITVRDYSKINKQYENVKDIDDLIFVDSKIQSTK